MNKSLQEVIDKLSTYTNGYDLDGDSISFLNRSYTQEQEEEFKEWMFNRLYNDKEFREEFMVFPRKNKELINRTIDMFIFTYSPKIVGKTL